MNTPPPKRLAFNSSPGFKVYKEKDAPPEVCPEFVPQLVQKKSTSIFSCFRTLAKIQADLEALKVQHEEDYKQALEKFQGMIIDNEEEGYSTISEEAFLALGKEELGWTGTHGVEVGMGIGLTKAQENLRTRIPKVRRGEAKRRGVTQE